MADVGKISVVVEGKDIGLSQLISDVQKRMGDGARSANDYAGAISGITPAQQRAEAKTLQFAQSLARSQVAAGDTSQAIYTLSTALNAVTPGTTAANNALTALQGILNKTSATAQQQTNSFRTFGGSLDSIKTSIAGASSSVTSLVGSFGALGGAFAVGQIASFTGDLINMGNELEKTEASVKALAGDQDFYNRIVELAKKRQQEFGGSLNDNIRDFGSFANLAKRTGVDIEFLTNAAARLAAIDPAQGLEGASLALKEFFSGSVGSLATRFELPRDLLNEVKNIKGPQEQAAALDAMLTKVGASQQILTNQANTTAVTFDKLKGSMADFGAIVGQVLASGLAPLADGLNNVLQAVNANVPAILNAGTTIQGFSDTILSSATSYDAYAQKVAEVNGQLPMFVSGIQTLTPAQYEFAQALMQTGATATEVNAALAQHGQALATVETVIGATSGAYQASAAEIQTFSDNLLYLAGTSDNAASYAIDLANSVYDGTTSFEAASNAVQVQVTALQEHAASQAASQAAQDAATASQNAFGEATNEVNSVLAENIQKQLESEQQAQTLAQMQQTLANLGGQVAGGLITAGNAASQMAQQYGIATSAALNLINAQAKLAGGGRCRWY